MDDLQEACATIPHSLLALHRVFVKELDGKISFKIIPKNNIDECCRYADWYEHGVPKKVSKPRDSRDRGSLLDKDSLTSSDPTIEKYTNVEEFVDECCKSGKDYTVNHNTLYKRYGVWCQTSKIPSVEIRSFIKTLKKLKYELKQNAWNGIGLI